MDLGEEYQASIPEVRPRPKQPLAQEAAWLGTRVMPLGAWGFPLRCLRAWEDPNAPANKAKRPV